MWSSNSFFCGIILGFAAAILFSLLAINQRPELLRHELPFVVQGACHIATRIAQFFRSFYRQVRPGHAAKKFVPRRAHRAADESVEVRIQNSSALAVREEFVRLAGQHPLYFRLLSSSNSPTVAHNFLQRR